MFGNITKKDITNRLEFDIESVKSSAIISSLRRSILADVKTVAFAFDSIDPSRQDIEFIKNTGALHNEYIGERLALVPLNLTKDEIEMFDTDSWRFELSVSSVAGDFLDVTTKDIKIVNTGPSEIVLDASSVFPPDPITNDHILLARLRPEKRGVKEELILEAKASHGSGDQHARWSPVCNCVSFPLPDQDAITKARVLAEDKHKFDTLEHKMYYKKNGFRFTIETCCGMTPEDIFTAGLETLQGRFRLLGEAFSSKDPVKIKELKTQGKSPNTKTLKLFGESDTAGAVLQQWIFDDVDFIGYYTPHAMEKSIVMTVTPKRENEDVYNILHEACVSVSKYLDSMITEWLKASQK